MKKSLLPLVVAGAVTLQAGFFDSAVQQAGSMMGGGETKTATATATRQNDLLSTLTGQLGVTPKQAAGGTAALMNTARQQMPAANYTSLLKSVPGLSSIVGGNEGLVNGAMQMMGGGDMTTKAFSALGMDGSMVGKFAPVLLDYIKKFATPENVSLLKQAWSAFL